MESLDFRQKLGLCPGLPSRARSRASYYVCLQRQEVGARVSVLQVARGNSSHASTNSGQVLCSLEPGAGLNPLQDWMSAAILSMRRRWTHQTPHAALADIPDCPVPSESPHLDDSVHARCGTTVLVDGKGGLSRAPLLEHGKHGNIPNLTARRQRNIEASPVPSTR